MLTPDAPPAYDTALSLIVFGFQPVFAAVPAQPNCFWAPRPDLVAARMPFYEPMLLDAIGLAGSRLFAQAAVFSSQSTPELLVSDSYILQL